ncbi:putative two-component system response regulator [Gammaproteobacteria bacterium]
MHVILIVDDSLNNLKVLSNILKGKYRVKVATGGNEALRLAIEEPLPDLILLDIMMPEMDGYEVCRRLKEDEATRDIPIIFLTALTSMEDETRGLELGASDYITKPINPPIVLTRIRTQLQLSQPFRQSKNLLLDVSDQLVKEAVARLQSDEGRQRVQEIKMAILRLLETSFQPMTLQEQLEAALDIINSVPWLMVQSKGAIFLAEPNGTLVLMAHRGLSKTLLEQCTYVAKGHCLCGRAAESRRIVYAEHVDEHHQTVCSGVCDHIHSAMPLLEGDRLLGVFQCHLPTSTMRADEAQLLMAELSRILAEIISRRLLDASLQVSRFELEGNQEEIIRRLGTAAEFRDNETGMHIVRMSYYAAKIAATIGLPEEDQKILLQTAPMHDVGKIGIPDSILLKEGMLTEEEFSLVKTHTTIGARILAGSTPMLSAARIIALSHHEKWDGSGYPNGLAGHDIPLFGRICAIADVFDALTTERPYKQAWSVDKAVELIQSQAARHFDPQLVDAFLVCLPDILSIKETYQDRRGRHNPSVFLRPLQMDIAENSPLWGDQYALGIDAIDRQHKMLFCLVDRLEVVLRERQAVLEICKVLRELESYVYIHFSDEEWLMLENNYKDYKTHRKQHEDFEKRVTGFWKTLRDNPFLTGTNLITFLRKWLIGHIMKEDMKLKEISRVDTDLMKSFD